MVYFRAIQLENGLVALLISDLKPVGSKSEGEEVMETEESAEESEKLVG